MASMRKLDKAVQRTHRERSQPSFRRHLGELEKKKDYVKRARDHEAKEKTLKTLHQKALEKNPDEFYFHMINSKVEGGIHVDKSKPKEDTDEQEKLMKTQDLRYVTLKLQMERKKMEKLRANLHLLDPSAKQKNTHTFFVDSEEDAKKFDPAKRLNTHPSMLDRAFNRPRLDDLREKAVSNAQTKADILASNKRMAAMYEELSKRIQREKELRIVHRKLFVKQQLLESKRKSAKAERVKRGKKDRAPVYKWVQERKR